MSVQTLRIAIRAQNPRLAGIAAIASMLLILVTEEGVLLAEYVTSVAAGFTLAILGVVYWTFKPESDTAIRERKQQIPADTSENSSLLLEKTKSPGPEFGGFFKKGIQYSTGIQTGYYIRVKNSCKETKLDDVHGDINGKGIGHIHLIWNEDNNPRYLPIDESADLMLFRIPELDVIVFIKHDPTSPNTLNYSDIPRSYDENKTLYIKIWSGPTKLSQTKSIKQIRQEAEDMDQ
ncbi:MAG: hypothetical protein WBE34_00480 [Candidatus Nitrosopolaris sp.]